MENNIIGAKKIMVWFRNDLRIHDHQPLLEASQKASEILPVFCFDPRQFGLTSFQTQKTGYFRTRFLIQSIQDLRNSFLSKGANLLIRVGFPEEILVEVAQQYGIQKVFAFKEVAQEEIALADLVEEKLWKIGISLNLYLGNTLYNKEDLPFPVKDIPDVFTQFRKRVERDSFVRECFPTPEKIQVPGEVEWGQVPSLEDLKVESEVQDPRAAMIFQGGESEGLRQIQDYIWERELIKTYKNTRNGLLGRDYSTKLSSWLSLGCISPRRVYSEIRRFERQRLSNDSTQWLIMELLWRDYFRFIMKKYGSRLFMEKGLKDSSPEINTQAESLFLPSWKEGHTGIPFIDANMRELNLTGFMSNRGRQNVASFLVHDLKIKWILGAAYFEEKLVDYNPSSNWGNWAYIAGVGNDPRENRRFNILKQAFEYDSKGEFIKKWIPELQNLPPYLIHQPYIMNQEQKELYNVYPGVTYPLPIIDFKKFEQQV